MAHVALTAHERTEFGNGPTRRLRRQGLVPGVVYQVGGPSLPFALPGHDLKRALVEGRTSVIDLSIGDSGPRPVLVKEWQLHPVRGEVMHVDFTEVDLKVAIETPVAILIVGDSVGVREGGVLDQPLREVVVSALPDNLPDAIEFDVSALLVGDTITVADLVAPEGVTITTDPEMVVASVVAPTVVTETDEEGGEEAGEPTAEAGAEGGESSEE